MKGSRLIPAAWLAAAAATCSGATFLFLAQPGATQVTADASDRRYRFDLERNFFRTAEAEVAGRAILLREAEQLGTSAGELSRPQALIAAIEADDALQRRFRRHDLYLFLRYAVDIRREGDLEAADALRARVRTARQTLRRAIMALDPATIATWQRSEPRLRVYDFLIETLRRDAPHQLAGDRQAVVSMLEPLLGASDYPRVVSDLRFATVQAGGEALSAGLDRSRLQADPSDQVRREGARQLMAGYAAQRDLLAHLMIHAVSGSNALARLRGHATAVDEAAFDAYVTVAGYEALLAEVARQGPSYRQWQVRTAQPMASSARWSAEEAAAAIVASAAALGPSYRREFAALLDPGNGRADLGGGENRLPLTGTASVYPIGTSAIYMQDFQGTLFDLIVLAHEGGHAVQAQLMAEARVPMAYASGPGYFTESFGRFQELLLLDHLRRTSKSRQVRREMRDALAARLLAVFPSAEEAAIELSIHRGVTAGRIRTADDLDAATATAGAPYSLEYERAPERRGVWMLSEGYFMAPMQELNDAYASLLAVRYFQLWRRNPEGFRRNYLALLSGGYGASPYDLLQRRLGIEMMATDFVAETVTGLFEEVDTLYR